MNAEFERLPEFEYVVVGSGAGGGTVAARLAEAGSKVLLLEAGDDAVGPDQVTDDYHAPLLHHVASENAAMTWRFFVRHYGSDELQKKDPKYRESVDGKRVDGVLYPRAATLGGGTATSAMITVYPHNDDWDQLASLTDDSSWKAENMRKYFERMEDCRHRPVFRLLSKLGLNPTRHGWNGWLSSEVAFLKSALGDSNLVQVISQSIRDRLLLGGQGDPNDWRVAQQNSVGLCYLPLATRDHARTGTREFVRDIAQKHPDRLTIELNALATKVILDGQNRAIGVEYLKGQRLYRAHADPSHQSGERRKVYVSREIVLSSGAFNTPQLLMLSGIGPKAELATHGIEVRVDLPGVGRNLQDRYEVCVVNRMSFDHWDGLEGVTFSKGGAHYKEWATERMGVYATNGAVLAVIKRSAPERPLPDLFCVALLGRFAGYFQDYSRSFLKDLNYLTWAVLKAHTNNTAGSVTLRSADPRDPPAINFHHFEEGNDAAGVDLDAVVEGVKFVRLMTAPLKAKGLIAEEELPGDMLRSDDELRDYVKYQAWGHQASCTCPIGRDGDPMAVLDGNFRVRGTQNLRVVDASVFPKIPGFFIVSSVCMIGEKASDVILAAAGKLRSA